MGFVFLDFDDIDLADADVVYVQIAERHVVIDRLTGEVAQLEHALSATARPAGAQ
ncbi:MAG: hypothetical protein PHQ28_01005 [Mycobacterium sp.]|nr:hypothetical protein [Mycobacterium sp.]